MKFVVLFAIFEVESPIPPDISVHQDLKIGIVEGYLPVAVFQEKLGLEDDVRKVSATPASTLRVPQHAETETDKSRGKKMKNLKKRKMIKGDPQLSLIPHFSNGVKKYIVHSRCFAQPFSKLRALFIAEMIDK